MKLWHLENYNSAYRYVWGYTLWNICLHNSQHAFHHPSQRLHGFQNGREGRVLYEGKNIRVTVLLALLPSINKMSRDSGISGTIWEKSNMNGILSREEKRKTWSKIKQSKTENQLKIIWVHPKIQMETHNATPKC